MAVKDNRQKKGIHDMTDHFDAGSMLLLLLPGMQQSISKMALRLVSPLRSPSCLLNCSSPIDATSRLTISILEQRLGW